MRDLCAVSCYFLFLLAGAGSCALVPELTEGPYYIDIDKVRSDIREDRQGTPLTLADFSALVAKS